MHINTVIYCKIELAVPPLKIFNNADQVRLVLESTSRTLTASQIFLTGLKASIENRQNY